MSSAVELFTPAPAVGELFESLEVSAVLPDAAQIIAPILRGNNLACYVPPSPGYAAGVAAAVATRFASTPTLRGVILAPAESVAAYGTLFGRFARAAGVPFLATDLPARAARAISAPGLLLTSPECAAELVHRSQLATAGLDLVVVIGAETCLSEELITPLFQDLNKEAQRLFLSADPTRIAPWIERYAWRAAVTGPLAPAESAPTPVDSIQTVASTWHDRADTLARLAEQLDGRRLAIWITDRSATAEIETALIPTAVQFDVLVGATPPTGTTTVFYDLPTPALVSTPGAYFLMPPGTEPYLSRWAARTRPTLISRAMDAARTAIERDRQEIEAALHREVDRGALAVLSPLFETWDTPVVAAALYQLWQRSKRAAAPPPLRSDRAPRASAKVWLSAGRKDGATPGDVAELLTRELAWDRSRLGKIEVRETYTLVEFPTEAEARRAAEGLAGLTLHERRLVARLDQGRPAGEAPRRSGPPNRSRRP